MNIETQCLYIYKIDKVIRTKLLNSRFRIVQAFGAFAINFMMGFCYATCLQLGQKENNRRKRNGRK